MKVITHNELIESIKSLGLEYGIVTPYTSYLVTEEQKELAQVQSEVLGGVAPSTVRRIKSQREARDMAAESDEESIGSVEQLHLRLHRAKEPFYPVGSKRSWLLQIRAITC